MTQPGPTSAALAPFFRPSSIAVIGASRNEERVGGKLVRLLGAHAFDGAIYPINPSAKTIAGWDAYPSPDATPTVADLAIVTLPADSAAAAVAAAAATGTRAALVVADAAIQLGADERRGFNDEIRAVARETGIRVIGPNTVGYRYADTVSGHGVWATYHSPLPYAADLRMVSTAIVSQGGGLAGYLADMIAREWGVGVSCLIDTGNEADVRAEECLDYVCGADSPAAVGLILESPSRARELIEAIRRAVARGVAVVVLLVGRTETGRAGAVLHTAALAGDAAALSAELTDAGAAVVLDAQLFADVLAVESLDCAPRGNGVGVVSWSGGFGIHAADICVEAGLQVPELPPIEDQHLLDQLGVAVARNPLDLSGVAERAGAASAPERLATSLDLTVGRPEIASAIVWGAGMYEGPIGKTLAPVLVDGRARLGKPIFVCGAAQRDVRWALAREGIMIFEMPGRITAVIATVATDKSVPAAPVPPPAAEIPNVAAAAVSHLAGNEALELLCTGSGIARVEQRAVPSETDAAAVAREWGGGLALKVDDPTIVHKSELGLVTLVATGADAAPAFRELTQARRRAGTDAPIVAQRLVSGLEVAAGGYVDDSLGKTIVLAAGGLYVELFGDRSFAAAPVDCERAYRMIRGLRLHPLLVGARGQEPFDVAALADAVVRISTWFAEAESVLGFDVNPLMVQAAGRGVIAVDVTLERAVRVELAGAH